MNLGKSCIVYYGAELRGPEKLNVGEGTILGDHIILDARRGGIHIGKYVRINSNVSLWTGSHDLNAPDFRSMPHKRGPITIGDRVGLGQMLPFFIALTLVRVPLLLQVPLSPRMLSHILWSQVFLQKK